MRVNRLTTRLTIACLIVAASAVAFAQGPAQPTSAPAAAPQQLYTCPMHPQIRWSRADACPLCGMHLVAMKMSHPSQGTDISNDHGSPQAHEGMPMDHAAMGHDMMGCGMCMQMMGMGNMSHNPAPAVQKAAPTAQRGYGRGGRGGRGCGC